MALSESPRLLVIDDSPDFFRFLQELTAPGSLRLHNASTGREAFQLLEKDAAWNLVVLDYQLPDALGTEILDQIRRHYSHLPVVIFTGHASIDLAVDVMKRGAVDFFTKPLEKPETFIRFLNRTLELEPPLPLPQLLPSQNVADWKRPEPAEPLSKREEEVLEGALEGLANKEIAQRLFLSERTVKNHMTHVLHKFGVESRARLLHLFMEGGRP